MKNLNKLSVVALLLCFTACHNKQATTQSSTFELSGTLTGGGEGITLCLDRISRDNTEHLDSTKLAADGTFAFHTNGIYKGFYVLRITNSDFATLILDSTEKVNITGNAQFLGDTYSVTGSPDTKLFCEYNQVSKRNSMQLDSLQKHYSALMNTFGGNKRRVDSLANAAEAPFDSISKPYARYLASFIKNNPTSFACLPAVQSLDGDKYLSYYIMLDSTLSVKYPNSVYVKVFHNDVEGMKRVAIGVVAPEISLPDTSGKTVNLSSLRGKVVLIDFWASWCRPCRESLPDVVDIFNKYRNKGFTVFSVSLDKDRYSWLDAIHKLHLTWTHVSDLKYWDSKVVTLYNFSGIPFSVLIDQDGKIVDKNMSPQDLDMDIEGLLKQKKM